MADLVAYIRTLIVPLAPPDDGDFVPDWTDHLINAQARPQRLRRVSWSVKAPSSTTSLSPAQQVYDAMMRGESFVLVDLRVAPDYLFGHIDGAVSVPFDSVQQAAEVISSDRWVITYCGCPAR